MLGWEGGHPFPEKGDRENRVKRLGGEPVGEEERATIQMLSEYIN